MGVRDEDFPHGGQRDSRLLQLDENTVAAPAVDEEIAVSISQGETSIVAARGRGVARAEEDEFRRGGLRHKIPFSSFFPAKIAFFPRMAKL